VLKVIGVSEGAFSRLPHSDATGGPSRLPVAHLYCWKSAKWVAELRLLDHDEPGSWEQNGYRHQRD
jgi:DMSO/TMAO reductase YedYZ molybdopterin-dependent catalytic subunit